MKVKKSFTLTEVLVASLILSATLGGLFATFTAARRYVAHSNRRMISVNLARGVSSLLYSQLGQDGWDDASGAFNDKTYVLDDVVIDNISYGRSYTVSSDPSREYRTVTITISYPEDQ